MSTAEQTRNALPEIPIAELPVWALWLWEGFGHDTFEIAEILDIPQADAERALHEALYGSP